ncbi:alpha-amylase 1-like isoform X1 [Rhodnius prolixus]|uniref:alpha-amylase 1-like isoform X1 n=2 Tax=Rhodnius prolixus TaxID=13249 RepID=UPI003D18CBE8
MVIYKLCLMFYLFCFVLISIKNVICQDNIIVHLFEWKFNDIARECREFLGPYGYHGVQVSPVNEYAISEGRPWSERYQPFSYKIISRSGNVEEFFAMVQACNKANVTVYVDVVFNHMSATLSPGAKGIGGSTADTKNKYYPAVPYAYKNFHKTCEILSYQDAQQVRNCELDGLHDLDHSQLYVRKKVINYLNTLLKLGVGGFRVDAAKHMWPAQLKEIYDQLDDLSTDAGFSAGSRPFIYQEVIDYGGEAIKATEYTDFGHVTEFRYGIELSRAFRGKNLLKWLRSFGPDWNLMPSKSALVFIDNHDTQRSGGDFLTYKDSRKYKMAVGFMLSWPYGTKRVMSSFDFSSRDQGPPHNPDMTIKDVTINPDMTCNNGWICEHRWRQIYNMVGFSNIVKGTFVENFWDNGSNQIAYCRGNKGFIAINGNNYDLNQTLMTCLPAGLYCDIISGLKREHKCTGKSVEVDDNGKAQIHLSTHDEDGILAIHIQSRLESIRNLGGGA